MATETARSCRLDVAGLRSRFGPAALNAYFDTSAIVKLVVAEAGSDLAEELWATSPTRISSQLLYPETRAALAAATRAGRIDAQTLRRAVVDLAHAAAAMRLIGIDDTLARAAHR